MIPLSVTADLEQTPWSDLSPRDVASIRTLCTDGQSARVERVGLLRHGTIEGRACVELLIRLPDGRLLVAETSLRLANIAARALAATPVYAEEDLSS